MNRRARMYPVFQTALFLVATGCEGFGAAYFEDKVNSATHQQVVNRYGPPHETEQQSPDREVWTYFDRGSSVGGYAGYERVQPCTEYHLTFDRDGILRAWEKVSCPR